jgi:hypothetical protein
MDDQRVNNVLFALRTTPEESSMMCAGYASVGARVQFGREKKNDSVSPAASRFASTSAGLVS